MFQKLKASESEIHFYMPDSYTYVFVWMPWDVKQIKALKQDGLRTEGPTWLPYLSTKGVREGVAYRDAQCLIILDK